MDYSMEASNIDKNIMTVMSEILYLKYQIQNKGIILQVNSCKIFFFNFHKL